MSAAVAKKQAATPSRRKMFAAFNIEWNKLPQDFADADESRAARLAWVSSALHLKRQIDSLSELSDRQLGLALDALRRIQREPVLPGAEVFRQTRVKSNEQPHGGAQIIHLASAEQVHTINLLLSDLGWRDDARRAFIKQRFRRENPVYLKPKEAQSLLRILLNIIASKELRAVGLSPVTRAQINLQIPAVKKRLGIDQKKVELKPQPTLVEKGQSR